MLLRASHSRFGYSLEPCVSAFLHLGCDFLQNTHFLPVCLSPLKFCNDSVCTKRDFLTEFPSVPRIYIRPAAFSCMEGVIGVGKPQRMCRPGQRACRKEPVISSHPAGPRSQQRSSGLCDKHVSPLRPLRGLAGIVSQRLCSFSAA